MTDLEATVADRMTRVAARARVEPVAIPASVRTIDPAAIADAMIAKARRMRIVERAHALDDVHAREWEVEAREGETIADAMERVIAEGMPPAISILREPSLAQLRRDYEALDPRERRDELDRHLWQIGHDDRPATRFSRLLDAMGVGR